MSSNKHALNSPQLEAVQHTDGPLLVLAGAGSGKTRVITYRIAYLIKRANVNAKNIIAVTFTNKAANEMRQRIKGLIGADAKEITLSTFHSLGLRILRKHINALGWRKDFTIYNEADQHSVIRTLIREHPMKGEKFDTGIILTRIADFKNNSYKPGLDFHLYDDKYDEVIPHFYERYQATLRLCHAVDFDDLILLPIRLFQEHPSVLKHYQEIYRYIMVDEYQDTNSGQYRFISLLAQAHKNICVVGDDDQSIYGWRGAKVQNILNFEKEYLNCKTIKLEENYRSTKTILSAANHVIANNAKRQEKKLWTKRKRGYNLDAFIADDENEEARTIAYRIEIIKDKTKAKWSDFAVIYRSNIQSRAVESTFRINKIPYVVVGGYEFFERKEVKDIMAYLRVIQNPSDDLSLLRVINYPRRGIGDSSIMHVSDMAEKQKISVIDSIREHVHDPAISNQARKGLQEWIDLVDAVNPQLGNRPLNDIVRQVVERSRYREELERTIEDPMMAQMKVDLVEELVSAATAFSEQEDDASLGSFIDSISLGDEPGSKGSKKLKIENAVMLVTLHSAKGLEFPYVFLCGMEEDLLPHSRSMNDGSSIDEERRLCYVGITRAQKHLTMSLVSERTKFGRKVKRTPSRFLKEIPPELMCKQFSYSPNFFDQQRVIKPKMPKTQDLVIPLTPKIEPPCDG